MRLIDADALMQKAVVTFYTTNYFSHITITKMIDDAPTVKTEQKTGKWTKAYDGNDGHVKCTACFKTYDYITQAQYFNYCPHCGAKMEVEE